MQRLKQIFLEPGNYRVGNRMVTVTREYLAELVANTKAVLAAGISIPLWAVHKKLLDPAGGPCQFSNADARDVMGWLVDVEQLPNGSLQQTLDVTDEQAASSIKSGSIKFTSPEIGEYTDGLGRHFGNVIRHMALTNTPRNPNQGSFTPATQFSLSGLQFSLDDKETTVMQSTQRDDSAMRQALSHLGVKLSKTWRYETGYDELLGGLIEALGKESDSGEELAEMQEERPPVGAQFNEDGEDVTSPGYVPRTMAEASAKSESIRRSFGNNDAFEAAKAKNRAIRRSFNQS